MANGHGLLAHQTRQAARRTFARLPQVDVRAREVALLPVAGATRAGNRPAEARLKRGRARIHVLAVEVQAGFEPQRVARAEPDRLDRRMCEELPRQRFRGFVRY